MPNEEEIAPLELSAQEREWIEARQAMMARICAAYTVSAFERAYYGDWERTTDLATP